jgi:hypothetical protein
MVSPAALISKGNVTSQLIAYCQPMAKPLGSFVSYTEWGHGDGVTLPGRVNEPHAVHEEGAVDGIQNRQLSQCLDGAEQHDADNDESNH